MKNHRTRISEAFASRKKLTEHDFDWLNKFLDDEQTKHPGSVELHDFTIAGDDPYVFVLLSVEQGFLGDVANKFGDHFPVPFTMSVLNRADPNPGKITVTISWGGGI